MNGMHIRRSVFGFFLLLIGTCLLSDKEFTRAADKDPAGWTPLFNGKDFSGWDTWLGKPIGEKEPLGLNNDPRKVYSIMKVDGKPAIHISGEVFGALTSKDEF